MKSNEPKKTKGVTYAFPIDGDDLSEIKSILSSGTGNWKSADPLKRMEDGKEGSPAMIDGKPVYLMIRLSSTEREKKADPLQLEYQDRVYVLLDTNQTTLQNYLNTATNISNSVRVPVATPFSVEGKKVEHSLEMWKNLDSDENKNNIEIDMEQQISNPGTAAGISVNEGWMDDLADYLTDELPQQIKRAIPKSVKEKIPQVVKDTVSKISDEGSKSKPAKAGTSIKSLKDIEKGGVLKVGSKGAAVKELQSKLGIEADGVFGPKTKQAVIQFQKSKGLDQDGIVGKDTVSKMMVAPEKIEKIEVKKIDKIKPLDLSKADSDLPKAPKVEPIGVAEPVKKTSQDLKSDIKGLRQEKRQEKKNLRQEKRDIRKDKREEAKSEKLEAKKKKIQDQIVGLQKEQEDLATSESFRIMDFKNWKAINS
jgi:hypothetical protein